MNVASGLGFAFAVLGLAALGACDAPASSPQPTTAASAIAPHEHPPAERARLTDPISVELPLARGAAVAPSSLAVYANPKLLAVGRFGQRVEEPRRFEIEDGASAYGGLIEEEVERERGIHSYEPVAYYETPTVFADRSTPAPVVAGIVVGLRDAGVVRFAVGTGGP